MNLACVVCGLKNHTPKKTKGVSKGFNPGARQKTNNLPM